MPRKSVNRGWLKQIQMTTDMPREQTLIGVGAFVAARLLAGDFENGGIVRPNLEVGIAADRIRYPCRLQCQQEQHYYREQSFYHVVYRTIRAVFSFISF